MIDKNQIENILRANGIAPSAKDEEIRSLLLSAKWTENDIDTALMVLKENIFTKKTHIDTLHKVFHSDERLSHEEITNLLGIKTNFSQVDMKHNVDESKQQYVNVIIMVILSLLIATTSVGYVMYKEQAGFFYSGFQKIGNK